MVKSVLSFVLAIAAGLSAMSATAASAPAQSQAAATPLVAEEWLWVSYESTEKGPRVCAPGLRANRTNLTTPCQHGADFITVKQYATAFLSKCPGAQLVSITPTQIYARGFLIGYTSPDAGTCPAPRAARKIGYSE